MAVERVEFSTDIGVLADRELVIESVREHEDTKLAIFVLSSMKTRFWCPTRRRYRS